MEEKIKEIGDIYFHLNDDVGARNQHLELHIRGSPMRESEEGGLEIVQQLSHPALHVCLICVSKAG